MRNSFQPTFRNAAALALAAAFLFGALPMSFGHDEVNHSFQSKVLTLLQQQLSAHPDQVITARIYELQPGTTVPRHIHDGEAFHLILEGQWAAEVEDHEMRVLKEGDSQFIARGKWHGGDVVGDHLLRLLTIVVGDKDKPLSTIIEQH